MIYLNKIVKATHYPKIGVAIVIFLLLPLLAYAQDSPITAWVNTNTISTDELVVLTVKVVDNSAQQPRPLLPRLDGLAVVDLDIATDVDLVNGQIRTEVVYTYRLQPRRTGLLTIPPVTVKIGGQTFKTTPISIKVNQGAAPAPSPGNAISPADVAPPPDLAGDDFFIEALVDLSNPYLGQQLIYTFRFYQALQVYRQPQFDSPLFPEFEQMGLPVQEYNLDAAGRTYLVSEIRTALFPKSTGRITIGPARLMLPGNIYEEPIDLYTQPVEIEVKPLPDNPPPGFSGAVGQYELEAWFRPAEAVVNQPATLFVAVSGIGNIRDLPDLIWPELPGWQAYNSLTSLTTAMEGNSMTGTRVYERVMVPSAIGDFVIPPISLVYFDPVAAEYRTISSASLRAKVVPAPVAPTQAAPAAAATALPANQPAVQAAAPPSGVGMSAWLELWELGRSWLAPVATVLAIGVCGVLPAVVVLGLGGNWLWQRRQALFEALSTPEAIKPAATLPPAEEPLQQPGQSIHPALVAAMKNNSNNYKAVSQALTAYLSGALQSSVNGLTQVELNRRLRAHGIDEALVRRIEACFYQSELGRFGPATDDVGWSLMVEADDVLFKLDRAFDRADRGGQS